MERIFENRKASAIIGFLNSESTGMGDPFRLSETCPALDSSGQPSIGKNFAFLLCVPWSPVRQFFSGIGADTEPVVVQQYPTGELRVIGSRRAMRHILRGIR